MKYDAFNRVRRQPNVQRLILREAREKPPTRGPGVWAPFFLGVGTPTAWTRSPVKMKRG